MPAFFHRLAQNPRAGALSFLALLLGLEVLILLLGPSVAEARAEIAEALATGDPVKHWQPITDIGIYYAALANLVLFAILAATSKWWTRAFETSVPEDRVVRRSRLPRWAPFALVAVFTATYAAQSFAGKSLWWDEMWAVKNCVLGEWAPSKQDPAQLRFKPTSWKKCAFYYQKPTNHAPMSLAQKASLTVWRTATGAAPSEFSEWAIRFPALLASGIAVVLLMRLIGAAKGATIGALLLAIHPWHLRYGVDARAYAFIVPLCLSAILAQRKLIFARGRSLSGWVWLALNQAAWIWVYPNAVLDVLVLFIVLAVFLWRAEETAKDRITAMLRLVVTHVFAAALWMQLFLPNLLQALQWAGKEEQGHQLDANILRETLAMLTFGMDWVAPSSTAVEAAGLVGLGNVLGGFTMAGVVIALGLSALGLFWALRNAPRTGWLMLAPVISSTLYALIGYALDIYFYPRFVIAVLPIFIAGISLSAGWFSDYTQVQRRIVIGIMVAFMFVFGPQLAVLRTRPYSGMKQAATFAQSYADRAATPPDIACLGLGREVIDVYSPRRIRLDTPEDLQATITKAKAAGRELLVLQGYTVFNRTNFPEAMRVLDDRTQFDELGAWPGIEHDFFFRVLRLK